MRVEDDTLSLCAEARELFVRTPIVCQDVDFARCARPWLAINAENVDLCVCSLDVCTALTPSRG